VSEALREIPAVRRAGAGLAERLVLRALERIEGGTIELRLPDGNVYRFGAGRPVTVEVASRDLFRRLLWRPRLGLGESYVAGDWQADDLPWLFELVIGAIERWRGESRLARLERFRPHVSPRQSLRRARRNIGYHYDLGNDLYRLFLDESLTYSCAVWEPSDSLEQAQQRKLRMACEKLDLGPGDHVLEIGCGWGSFALTAAGDYGARVTGLTISEQQVALARQRIAEAGLGDRVEIFFQDYRTLEGQFTKLASIEMIEAIGYAQFPTFFAACDRLLIMENAFFSVIGPEGAAAILRREDLPAVAGELRLTAHDLRRFGLADRILPEPEGGAQADAAEAVGTASIAIEAALRDLANDMVPSSRRFERWRVHR